MAKITLCIIAAAFLALCVIFCIDGINASKLPDEGRAAGYLGVSVDIRLVAAAGVIGFALAVSSALRPSGKRFKWATWAALSIAAAFIVCAVIFVVMTGVLNQ